MNALFKWLAKGKIDARLVAALGALIAATAVTVVITDDDKDGKPDRITVTIQQRAPAGDLQESPAAPGEKPTDSELRDDTPENVPAPTLEQGKERTDDLGEKLEPSPVGGAQNYSCRQDFSGHVYSTRSIRPTEVILHYTVSPNVAGWGDVLGIQSYFKRTRVASATRIIDFEGHCVQMVPFSGKPWTQGAANGAAYASYEIIATGRESRAQWLASPLFKKGILSSVARDDARRGGIPLRWVNPVGCVFPPGITDHNSLECGNNHTDVAPNFPRDVFLRQLRAGPVVASRWHSRCRRLNATRAKIKAGQHVSTAERRKASELRAVLIKGRYRCSGSRAVRK